MWYEIVPVLGIMTAAMGFAFFGHRPFNLYALGTWHFRDMRTTFHVNGFHRDERITGTPYKPMGLECIEDEPSTAPTS